MIGVSVDRDVVAAWVEASCRAQGVAVKISDPLVLGRVGVLLGMRADGPRAHGAPAPSTRATAATSQPPVGLDAVGVQAVASTHGGWHDGDVIEYGLDDGGLTGEVQVRPLSA